MMPVNERNKEVDFKIIEKASNIILDKLRADEANSDIYDQFQYRPDIIGSQRYFIEPYKTTWGPQVEYLDFIPLPESILQQYSNIECASFMGILPEINRVWVTVDNKLFIWNYYRPEEVEVFDGITEVIVSVSLSAPKPGVFLDSVKFVLVVASPIEVVVLAISCDADMSNLKLIPTIYKLPSDNVTMFKIAGSQNGRIFMAGNDSNLYELDYTNSNQSWASALGVAPPHKCQKINHFAWNWKVVHVLPQFFKTLAGNVPDSLAEIAVDNVRNLMYVVTSKGVLSAFYLGASGAESHFFVKAFNIFEEARSYLSNNRNVPESSPKADSFSEANTAAPGFVVVGLFIIPLVQSKKAHLLVVLGNGIRLYLSVRTTNHSLYYRIPGAGNPSTAFLPVPSALEISYVRSPPSQNAVRLSNVLQQCSGVDDSVAASDLENGSVPVFVPSQPLRVSNALYSSGTVLMTLDKQKQPDELLAICDDHVYRTVGSLQAVQSYQPPSLKEGISVVMDASNNGGKIHDIKEDCSYVRQTEIAEMCSLFVQSSTPTSATLRDGSHHFQTSRLDLSSQKSEEYLPADYPVTHASSFLVPAPQLAPQGLLGYDRNNLEQVAILSELTHQAMPSGSASTQRQFLVLTNQGLHVFKRVRPADVLQRNLSELSHHGDELTRYFFDSYNPLQASAMCVAVACGLPSDAGGSRSVDPAVNALLVGSAPSEAIQTRAMSVMFALTAGPSYRGAVGNLLGTGVGGIVSDSRVVFNPSGSAETIFSVAHEALYLTFSRIVRPIWLRSVLRGSSVDEMWTVPLIAQIRGPLFQLLNLLRGYFPLAVSSDPNRIDFQASLQQNPSEHLVTRQLQQQAQATTAASAVKTAQQQAKNAEDASINALYRLVSRVTHALSLMEVLLTMSAVWHLPVDWARLGGGADITFRTLVISAKAHDSVKRFLNGVINQISRSDKTQIAERAIDWLTNECYHYFSAGDRYLYEASRLLDSLRRLGTVNESRSSGTLSFASEVRPQELQEMSMQVVNLLSSAARFWINLENVSGDSSELWSKSTELLTLDQVGRDGVVDLCLLVAGNFNIMPSGLDKLSNRVHSMRSIVDLDGSSCTTNSAFDSGLYHGGAPLNDTDRAAGVRACYTCLIQQIMAVGRDVPRLGEGMVSSNLSGVRDPLAVAAANMRRMVARAVAHTADELFHDMLYSTLFNEDQEQLFAIRSPFIESFLRETDATKLYSYYEFHGEFMKASNLMSLLAHVETDLDIATRILYLQRAVASAEKAVTTAGQMNTSIASPRWSTDLVLNPVDAHKTVSDIVVELKDTLDIAEFQLIAYEMLADDFQSYGFSSAASSAARSKFTDSQRRQLEAMESIVGRLHASLLSITTLFHEVCLPYRLWDVALRLLHVSRQEDIDLVARLWRSFIYRIVPESGATEEASAFLRLKRDGHRIDVDKRHQRSDVMFESHEAWLPALELQLVQLGQALNGAQDATAFPLMTLLDELEELAATLVVCGSGAPRGWATRCLMAVGLPHGALVESYMQLFDEWAGKSPEKLLHVVVSTTAVLQSWTSGAVEHSSASASDTRQLLQAARTGRFRNWLEQLRRHLSTLGSRHMSPAAKQLLESTNTDLVEVNGRVNGLTFV